MTSQFTMFSVLVDLINAPKDAVKGQKGSLLGPLIDAVLLVYSLAFCFFRVGELVPIMNTYPLEFKTGLIGAVSLRLMLPNR